MSAASEARRIAANVLEDFARMFPGSRLLPAERQYLAALIASQVREVHEVLPWNEDDRR
jgi:hypothetical protein